MLNFNQMSGPFEVNGITQGTTHVLKVKHVLKCIVELRPGWAMETDLFFQPKAWFLRSELKHNGGGMLGSLPWHN